MSLERDLMILLGQPGALSDLYDLAAETRSMAKDVMKAAKRLCKLGLVEIETVETWDRMYVDMYSTILVEDEIGEDRPEDTDTTGPDGEQPDVYYPVYPVPEPETGYDNRVTNTGPEENNRPESTRPEYTLPPFIVKLEPDCDYVTPPADAIIREDESTGACQATGENQNRASNARAVAGGSVDVSEIAECQLGGPRVDEHGHVRVDEQLTCHLEKSQVTGRPITSREDRFECFTAENVQLAESILERYRNANPDDPYPERILIPVSERIDNMYRWPQSWLKRDSEGKPLAQALQQSLGEREVACLRILHDRFGVEPPYFFVRQFIQGMRYLELEPQQWLREQDSGIKIVPWMKSFVTSKQAEGSEWYWRDQPKGAAPVTTVQYPLGLVELTDPK